MWFFYSFSFICLFIKRGQSIVRQAAGLAPGFVSMTRVTVWSPSALASPSSGTAISHCHSDCDCRACWDPWANRVQTSCLSGACLCFVYQNTCSHLSFSKKFHLKTQSAQPCYSLATIFSSLLPQCTFNLSVLQERGNRADLTIPVGIMTWPVPSMYFWDGYLWPGVVSQMYESKSQGKSLG